MGVVAGHEIEHATNEQNIKEEAINVQFGYNMYDIEKAPNEIGKKIVNESKSQVINKMEPKPAFNH